jgi:hypothetical protein
MPTEPSPDRRRFEWLLSEVKRRADDLHLKIAEAAKLEVFMASTALLRLALTYAESVQVLMRSEELDGTGPLQRAIYELWLDHSYLHRHGDPAENSIRLQVNSHLEILAFARERLPPNAVELATNVLNKFEHEHPAIVEEVRRQRANRRYHWSGLSWSAIDRELHGSADLYRTLSWEAHAVMAPIRDVDVSGDPANARFAFGPKNVVNLQEKHIANFVGGVVFFMWNEWAKYFGISLIVVPEDRDWNEP